MKGEKKTQQPRPQYTQAPGRKRMAGPGFDSSEYAVAWEGGGWSSGGVEMARL